MLVLGLSACSSVQKDNVQTMNDANSFSTFVDSLKTVTAQDIDTAMADVHANGDVDLAALQCYPALKDFLASNPTLQKPTVDGLISANQLKRDVLLGVQKNGALTMAIRKLHVACSAYASDEKRFAAEFLIAIGAASHGVPPVSGIPGALSGAVSGILR
jgi:hypothetical protein